MAIKYHVTKKKCNHIEFNQSARKIAIQCSLHPTQSILALKPPVIMNINRISNIITISISRNQSTARYLSSMIYVYIIVLINESNDDHVNISMLIEKNNTIGAIKEGQFQRLAHEM